MRIDMKQLIVFLSIVALGSATTFESGLRVKFSYGLNVGEDFFYELPQTVDNATALNWTQLERPTSTMSRLVMYCPDERVICILYDPDTGFVAGIQAGVSNNTFTGAIYNWTTQGFTAWTPPAVNSSADNVTYMVKDLYFISEETLSKSTEERQATAAENEVLQEESIWVTGFNQELKEIPINDTDMVEAGFTEQNCIPWIGTQYFLNMTTDLTCTAETLFNWFMLVDSGKAIGVGLLLVGEAPETSEERYFYERPSKTGLELFLKTCPDCLAELADNPTITMIHIYFINEPWDVGCPMV